MDADVGPLDVAVCTGHREVRLNTPTTSLQQHRARGWHCALPIFTNKQSTALGRAERLVYSLARRRFMARTSLP
jgi:hypothetical protein